MKSSDHREALQTIADELNHDAIDDGDHQHRWIVVRSDAVGELFDPVPAN